MLLKSIWFQFLASNTFEEEVQVQFSFFDATVIIEYLNKLEIFLYSSKTLFNYFFVLLKYTIWTFGQKYFLTVRTAHKLEIVFPVPVSEVR